MRAMRRLAALLSLLLLCAASLAEDADRLAAAQKSIRTREIGSYGMVPIYARDIADGVYDVQVESTSNFFKITNATLIVENGEMRADITIGSASYLYVYMGTAKAARHAEEADWIAGEQAQESTTFTIPVPALNAAFDCAAYSRRRKRWYARQLLIDASNLPAEALAFELPDYELAERAIAAYRADGEVEVEAEEGSAAEPEPVELTQDDGEYSIEVNMTGGSGRASVSSPTLLIVRDGRAYARLLWSSAYYDYMLIGGERYENLTTDGGNSTFEIPITAMDEPMDVIADTTAMGDPIEIEYALTFYSESIGDRSLIPQEAAKKVLMISAAVIAVGAVLNHFAQKRRK